jgi:EKC/KEOPS complex subunit CGI121/TPRKB
VRRGAESDHQIDYDTHLKTNVEGTPVQFDDESLKQISDLQQIRKLYKLDAPVPSKAHKGKPKKVAENSEDAAASQTNGVHALLDDVAEMEAVILGIMALKGS